MMHAAMTHLVTYGSFTDMPPTQYTHTRDGKNDGSDTHTDIIKVNVAA